MFDFPVRHHKAAPVDMEAALHCVARERSQTLTSMVDDISFLEAGVG